MIGGDEPAEREAPPTTEPEEKRPAPSLEELEAKQGTTHQGDLDQLFSQLIIQLTPLAPPPTLAPPSSTHMMEVPSSLLANVTHTHTIQIYPRGSHRQTTSMTLAGSSALSLHPASFFFCSLTVNILSSSLPPPPPKSPNEAKVSLQSSSP